MWSHLDQITAYKCPIFICSGQDKEPGEKAMIHFKRARKDTLRQIDIRVYCWWESYHDIDYARYRRDEVEDYLLALISGRFAAST